MTTDLGRVFIAGHQGLVGRAIHAQLVAHGHKDIVVKKRCELDLLDRSAVKKFFASSGVDTVILAAAKVGGIGANDTYRADFIYENTSIQCNVIWEAHSHNVDRLVFLGSSCIYPRKASQPMREDCLLSGALEPTNSPYALAKINGLALVDALRHQYSRRYYSLMPTNVYGEYDNFSIKDAHVIPALIRRFYEASIARSPQLLVWGSGKAKREFIHASDLAKAVLHLLLNYADPVEAADLPRYTSHINVGSGRELSIRELAHIVAGASEYRGEIRFDCSRPDGSPRKLLDTSVLDKLGWKSQIPLESGIDDLVTWFRAAHANQAQDLRL